MEVSSNICHFICVGAFHDFKSPFVSTSSGLGFYWDCNNWGLFWNKTLQFLIWLKSHAFSLCFLKYLSLYYNLKGIQANSFIFFFFFFFPQIFKFFVIGHDCAHKSFSRNKLVEDIVGTLAFMPLIYPYEAWRFKHDRHHAKTNMSVWYSLFILVLVNSVHILFLINPLL